MNTPSNIKRHYVPNGCSSLNLDLIVVDKVVGDELYVLCANETEKVR